MVKDETLKEAVTKYLREKNEEERRLHEPSGKLSASILSQPLQWQVLKVLGVAGKEVDDYTLGVFERGRHCEDWLIQILKPRETQKRVEYRGVVGVVDAIREYPEEIKSVKNSKFKRIETQGEADRGHKMQGCLYALAENTDKFAVLYVAADDYRTLTFVYDTSEVKDEVEQAINEFDAAMKSGQLPTFKEKESWHKIPQYNPYPEWQTLTAEECIKKLKKENIEAYNKLKGIK